MAYGGFQARSQIRAVAADLHHSSQQCQILNPLSKATDRTHDLMVPRQNYFRCAMMGTPFSFLALEIFRVIFEMHLEEVVERGGR